MKPSILFVDDDEDIRFAVRLALEPGVKVHEADTLAKSLEFLSAKGGEIQGVIVDLNLTHSTDNFGREVLIRLREMAMPCVIFSSSIKSQDDVDRYANEFGVLGTIGKKRGADDVAPLDELIRMVNLMIERSTLQRRERVRQEIEAHGERRLTALTQELEHSRRSSAQESVIGGKSAGRRFEATERSRLEVERREFEALAARFLDRVNSAETIAELEEIRDEWLRLLGAK